MTETGASGEPAEHGPPPSRKPEAIAEIVRRCDAFGIEVDEHEPDSPKSRGRLALCSPRIWTPRSG